MGARIGMMTIVTKSVNLCYFKSVVANGKESYKQNIKNCRFSFVFSAATSCLVRNGSSGNSIGGQEGLKTVFGGNCQNRDENGIHVTRKGKTHNDCSFGHAHDGGFQILKLRAMPNVHVYL